jgi:glucan phosphoethanolaminetransferase (alkaline phosphatase superfamily)
LNTNIGEAAELLMTIKWQCFILLLLWTSYYFITFRKIKNNFLFSRKYYFIAGVSVIALNLMLFSTMYATEYRQDKSQANINEATNNFVDNYRCAYPCNIIATLVRKYNNHITLKNLHKNIASFSYHARQNSSTLPEREIYVVIIGESARYGNFSINGYERHTSPQLEKIKNIITYSDVYATSTVTEFALPLLLSSATPLNPEEAFKEKTFADAFRECGFYAGWIANQSGCLPYIKRIAKDMDETFFISDESENYGNYDGLLLPYIDSLLNKNEQKTFIVIHTLGSHFRYNFRYPKSFERYVPALEGIANYSIISDKDKELIINAYDNSVYYTDFILSEIINKVASQQCISTVLYISDHAENLYDNGSLSVFHGSKIPPKAEVHIPLFIWTSPDYNRIYPHKQKALKANINKKISASNLFYSILDIADISYSGEKPEKSIASDSFKEDSIRYVYTANKEVIHFQ